APLKENLAAGVLLRGGWPRVYAEGGALLDPMCGSGTLLVEGALMAADVAPGLQRISGTAAPAGDDDQPRLPTRWRGFDRDAWAALWNDARGRERAGRAALRSVFYGSDMDRRAIDAAIANATAAGLAEAINLRVAPIERLAQTFPALAGTADAGPPPGLAVCNPPYDARLAADPALYRALGDALAATVPTWRASLLCGDEELAFATGLRARKRYRVFNGAPECSLIVSDPVMPERRPPAEPRALGEGAQLVANRLRKNLRSLKSWRARAGVDCCRAYDADLPEYAAAIDVYTQADDPDRLWLHVQEYAPPASVPEHTARRRLGDLLAAAREVFELP